MRIGMVGFAAAVGVALAGCASEVEQPVPAFAARVTTTGAVVLVQLEHAPPPDKSWLAVDYGGPSDHGATLGGFGTPSHANLYPSSPFAQERASDTRRRNVLRDSDSQ